jgi:hypothetical protein
MNRRNLALAATMPLAPFRLPARVLTRGGLPPDGRERWLLARVQANAGRIVARARQRLAMSWESFEADQGVDPLAGHARVEIHLPWPGSRWGWWTLVAYWSADEPEWAGAHLRFSCWLTWPRDCEEVF